MTSRIDDASGEQEIPKNWLRTLEAARLARTTTRWLQRMHQTGRLKGKRDREGNLWFDPDEIAGVRKDAGVVEEIEMSSSDIIRAASSLLEQSERHAEELLEPNRELLRLLVSDKETDRKRILELEDRVIKMLEASEKALSQEQERMLQREEFDAQQKRLDKGLDFLMSFSPLVQAYVAKHFGLPHIGEENGIADFVGSFTPQEIFSMCRDLPQEKQVVILGLYDQVTERKKAADAKAKESAPQDKNGAP